MDADLLREKGLQPVNIRPASVSAFALRIGERATLVNRTDARTYGTLPVPTPF
jgi:hypothetical protein